ncbi:MAG: T9SS type A sorting domain-containing protein [Saprospiraceae bacterium]|nr:T9SS type A sorting domain-containing protein [Saprospiraceae bacterium]
MFSKLITLLIISFPLFVTSQKVWTKTNESEIHLRNSDIREIIPQKYQSFTLDILQLQNALKKAPMEFSLNRNEASLEMPMPDGSLKTFLIWESPVMEDELAAKYPSIKSYKGYQKDDRTVTTRFGLGPNGFYAAIKAEEGMIYVDPYSIGNRQHFITYYTSDHEDLSLRDRVMCGTKEDALHYEKSNDTSSRNTRLGDKIELRKYRLALGCTGEWGEVRGTKENALSDMVIFVDRANVVFESELAVRLVLIGQNDKLIYLDGTLDPYENSNQGQSLVGKNTAAINGRVGSTAYDIGHLFSICFDVGGVAQGYICTAARGAGVTCHNESAVNRSIVLTFNHEVGHQMTAAHTFNNCPGNEDQLSASGYEPGGGSTIMAYPTACGSSSLGVSRDDYYHVATLDQILSYTNSESSDAYACAEKIEINNFVPIISMPYKNGFYIPKGTPFFLKASAEDANGDILKYNWDQFDKQNSSPLGFPIGNAPIFRSIKPTTNPSRYFPNISRIFGGQFKDNTELLPTYGRELNFRFVVRDNNPLGSAAVWEQLKFNVADNAGPFKLTYPAQDTKFKIGKEIKITWDVANTDIAPVNCKYVDIYISYNNSLDFDSENMMLLAQATLNDGNETIIIPNKTSNKVRFVIKASENIFLTTSLFNSFIQTPEVPAFFMDVTESTKYSCLPDPVSYSFTSAGFAGITDKIKWEIASGLPEGAIAMFEKSEIAAGENNNLIIDLNGVNGTGEYKVIVRSFVEGLDTIERTVQLFLTGTDLNNISLLSPSNGSDGLSHTQKYEWTTKSDATSYILELATSPDFKPEHIVFSKVQTGIVFVSNNILNKATIYYWRVRSSNNCKSGEWSEIYAFTTEALSCVAIKSGDISINISSAGQSKIEAPVNVSGDGIISDLNLRNIKGEHQWVGDLMAYLVAPSGKEVLLWSRKCGSVKSFNIGVDDQSNDFFQCPINTGRIYKPESPLSAFNGESMKGKWILRLEDKASGNGGKLQNFDIEICANIVLNPPVLTRNVGLNIHPKDQKIIDRVLLLSEDANNTPTELTYTLVQGVTNGLLTLNGVPVSAGSIFTQDDIDKFELKYIHTADNESEDSFKFTVSDGQGGWVSITNFVINVDASTPSFTKEESLQSKILIYPNPAHDVINIQSLDATTTLNKCTLFDISGRVIQSTNIVSNLTSINIEDLQSGVYLIKLSDGKASFYHKIVKK